MSLSVWHHLNIQSISGECYLHNLAFQAVRFRLLFTKGVHVRRPWYAGYVFNALASTTERAFWRGVSVLATASARVESLTIMRVPKVFVTPSRREARFTLSPMIV